MKRLDEEVLVTARGVAEARRARGCQARWTNASVLMLLDHIAAVEQELAKARDEHRAMQDDGGGEAQKDPKDCNGCGHCNACIDAYQEEAR